MGMMSGENNLAWCWCGERVFECERETGLWVGN